MSGPGEHVAELARIAGLHVVDGDGAPVVKLDPDVNATATRLGEIITRLDLFEMNGELVYFNHEGRRAEMTARVFRTWINDYVIMACGFQKDSGLPIPGALTIQDSGTVLDCINFRRGVRKLVAINHERLPVVREDGALNLLPWGYDIGEQSYTVPGGLVYDLDVSLESARVGLDRVDGEFPFTDERSRAVQRAAYLAMFCKHLPGGDGLRPGFLWLGNKPGVGKSVIAKGALYPVLGSAASAKMKKNEDLDKELEAFVRAGVPYIFLDNVYGSLASASLDQLLTSKRSTGRAMGGHGIFEADNKALVLVTGNRLELNEDAARRFLVIDLFEKGDPEEREVTNLLDDDLMGGDEWRSLMLGYCYAMVRNWHEAGMPQAKVVLPTYERFSRMLGGIVVAAGFDEPFQRAIIPDAISPERAEFAELVGLVLKEMEGKQEMDFTLEDLARMARSLEIYGKEVGSQSEGKKLTIREDQVDKEARWSAEDRGYMTPSHRSAFGKKISKVIGGEPRAADGRRVEFGRREQSRKATFTVRVLE
jgi:hypothetical protein